MRYVVPGAGIEVEVHDWPRNGGPSLEHEVGARAAANRVRVLTGKVPGEGPSLVSWRDGKHATADEGERLANELLVAVRIAREYDRGD